MDVRRDYTKWKQVSKVKTVCCKLRVPIMAALGVVLCFVAVYVFTSITASASHSPKHRKFFIAAEETDWNYSPRGSAHATEHSSGNADDSARTSYKKAVYREYTDDTYVEKKHHDPYLGILGPVLKAEVGDTLEVHLLNKASHPVTLHAHGVLYAKEHEGALYGDGTDRKMDDSIPPGYNHTYHWSVTPERGPTASDDDCILFAYHSHVTGDTDIHSGLIGPLIVCKQGKLENRPKTKEFVLLFLIFDENACLYADENKGMTRLSSGNESEKADEDEEFSKMYSVNGYVQNTLPGLEACVGSDVTWYLMGMGNEDGIHSVAIQGYSFLVDGHRTDVVHLYPGKFATARMKSTHVGTWSIQSDVREDYVCGMEASLKISRCLEEDDVVTAETSTENRSRPFHIAIEEVRWNYTPTADNDDESSPIRHDKTRGNGAGMTYTKAMYVEYLDQNFTVKQKRHPSLGFLGPTLRAEAGETLVVHLLNKATRPYSFRSTAFTCNGCPNGVPPAVSPGESKTMQFYISDELAPTPRDPHCITWRYYSGVDPLKDSYSGLNGVLLTCKKGALDKFGNQRFVDTEYSLMFANIDENESHYFENNTEGSDSSIKESESFAESNRIHAINGFARRSLPDLNMCTEGNNSLHIITIGGKEDMHVVHFVGNQMLHHGTHKETVELLPGGHITAMIQPQATGSFLFRSESAKDIEGGMQATYAVESCTGQNLSNNIAESVKKVRSYYIAAVEIEWDYAPSRINPITGVDLVDDEEAEIFVRRGETFVGSKYRKAVFREFIDETFTTERPRSSKDTHLGLLGPLIKAEVGDVVEIHFMNNSTREFNIRPHGVFDQANEILDEYQRGVEPGGRKLLRWNVPESAGPSSNGFNCTNWMYYSTVDAVKDTNSGLVGPLVVCREGTLDEDGTRKDVDKEFSVIFTVSDENESWYLDDNIARYCSTPSAVQKDDPDFTESNKIHGVNGRIYGSLGGLDGRVGEKVAWYLMGLGSEIDLHTAHFHGLSAVEKSDDTLVHGKREDVIDLFPGVSRTIEMLLDNPGTWLFHCHVDDHLKAGMFALVTVIP